MADYTVPFAPTSYRRPERYTNPYIGSLLDLMQRQAAAQADYDQRRMQLSGQLWQGLGQTGATIVQAIAEAPERRRQAEVRRAQDEEVLRNRDILAAVDKMPLTTDIGARQAYMAPLPSPQRRAVEERYRADDVAAQERADAAANRRGEEALAGIGRPGTVFSSMLEEQLRLGRISPQQYARTLASAGDSGNPAQVESEALTRVYLSSPAGRKAMAGAVASNLAKEMAAAPDARKASLVAQQLRPDMPAAEQLQVFRSVWGPQGDAKFKEYADALSAAAPKLTTFGENQGVIQTDPVTGTPTVFREPSPSAPTFQDVDAKVTSPDGAVYVGKVGFNPRTNSYAPIGSRDPFPAGTRVERAPTPVDPTIAALRDAQLTNLRGVDGGLSGPQFTQAMQLANSLKAHPAYADMADIATGWQGVQTGLSQKNGFGDIVAINAIQRMVDPGATVREGDVALLQSASALVDRVLSDYPLAKLKTGDKLPQAVRDRLRAVAEQLYAARAKNYNDTVGTQYRALAEAARIPFALIGSEFPAPRATTTAPDLSGLKAGTGRRFTEGPFAGQTWTVDAAGTPQRVK